MSEFPESFPIQEAKGILECQDVFTLRKWLERAIEEVEKVRTSAESITAFAREAQCKVQDLEAKERFRTFKEARQTK